MNVTIGTKFVHDTATINNSQYGIYLCSYVAVDLIPDLHTIAYIHVMVTILVFVIVLVPMDK